MKGLPAVEMDGVKEGPVRVTPGLLETTVKLMWMIVLKSSVRMVEPVKMGPIATPADVLTASAEPIVRRKTNKVSGFINRVGNVDIFIYFVYPSDFQCEINTKIPILPTFCIT